MPYFHNLDRECLYHLIFSLSTRTYPKNFIFQKPKEAEDNLYLLQKGVIEVYTISEGREFILDRLYRGSVVGHITFF